MKTFKYTLNGQELSIRIDEKNATIADLLIDGKHPEIAQEQMAAFAAVISLALIEYDVEVVHDDEPGEITLLRSNNEWGNPSAAQNRIGTSSI